MSESRYTDSRVIPPGPWNARAELSARELIDGDALERAGRTYEYVCVQGDRIDLLAFDVLGDSRSWSVIADMNPHVDPLFLRGGDVLRLPRLGPGR